MRRLRVGQHLSQERLAEKADCHRNYIGMVERGERNPSLTRVVAIAVALRCRVGDLFANVLADGGG